MKLMFTAYPIKRILPIGCPSLFELDKTKPSYHNLFDKNDLTSQFTRMMILIQIPFYILIGWFLYILLTILI
jgi:hypothetical protein